MFLFLAAFVIEDRFGIAALEPKDACIALETEGITLGSNLLTSTRHTWGVIAKTLLLKQTCTKVLKIEGQPRVLEYGVGMDAPLLVLKDQAIQYGTPSGKTRVYIADDVDASEAMFVLMKTPGTLGLVAEMELSRLAYNERVAIAGTGTVLPQDAPPWTGRVFEACDGSLWGTGAVTDIVNVALSRTTAEERARAEVAKGVALTYGTDDDGNLTSSASQVLNGCEIVDHYRKKNAELAEAKCPPTPEWAERAKAKCAAQPASMPATAPTPDYDYVLSAKTKKELTNRVIDLLFKGAVAVKSYALSSSTLGTDILKHKLKPFKVNDEPGRVWVERVALMRELAAAYKLEEQTAKQAHAAFRHALLKAQTAAKPPR